MTARLAGKVALISGGGSGIGAATARRFATAGARSVLIGRRAEPLERVARETGALAHPADVADPSACAALVDTAYSAFGGIDLVVANAGVLSFGDLLQADPDSWSKLMAINVDGVANLVRAALPALLDRGGGAIVIVSSVAGVGAAAGAAAYITSKAALLGLMRALAVDYGPRGIRVNAICPGWVRTEMNADGFAAMAAARGQSLEEFVTAMTRHVPLRRMSQPYEIAAAIEFLCSEDASFITGAVLMADGGSSIVDAGSLGLSQS